MKDAKPKEFSLGFFVKNVSEHAMISQLFAGFLGFRYTESII